MANQKDRGAHEIHASGLASLMKVENSPMSLMGPVLSGQRPGLDTALHVSLDCFLPRQLFLTACLGLRHIFCLFSGWDQSHIIPVTSRVGSDMEKIRNASRSTGYVDDRE